MITEEQFRVNLRTHLQDGIDLLRRVGIPVSSSICPDVKIVKMRSRLADCCGRNCAQNKSSYSFQIRFSSYTMGMNEHDLHEVMLHELLHTCPDCMNHGWLWRSYASQLIKYGYDIHRTTDNEVFKAATKSASNSSKSPLRKIVLECTGCGKQWVRYRNSRLTLHPDWYRCNICHSNIIRK